MGLYAFRPSFRRLEVGLGWRDISLWGTGPPPLPEAGVVCVPSPPLLVVFPVVFYRGRVCQFLVSGF